MKMFNKRIKLYDIEVGSLVWVEFGETKHIFLKDMERQLKEECFSLTDCPHGLNLLHEFSYYYLAFIMSNKVNDTVADVPITEYKVNDKIFINSKENQKLTQLRNWLLPMLMYEQVIAK